MNLTAGALIADRYQVTELIGSGGMADVVEATDQVLGRDVAVKVLRATTVDPSARARFDAEARTLAALNHAGIVTILDAGIEGAHPFLVMELITGPTLGDRIRSGGPLDPAETAALGLELAGALGHAHASGVVHRDVKPANILLRPDGSAVLSDFGIARLLTDAAQYTRTGEVIGSPAYLAPEQVNGSPISAAVDIYALGLVLIEASSGTRAYAGLPHEAALARLAAPPVVPVSLAPQLQDLLRQMTALAPEARPTALEVEAALRGISGLGAHGLTSQEAPAATALLDLAEVTRVDAFPVAAPETSSSADRRRLLIGAGVAALAVVLATGITQAGSQRTPEAQASAAPSNTSMPTQRPSAPITPVAASTQTPQATAGRVAAKAPTDAKAKSSPKAKAKAKKPLRGPKKGTGRGPGRP